MSGRSASINTRGLERTSDPGAATTFITEGTNGVDAKMISSGSSESARQSVGLGGDYLRSRLLTTQSRIHSSIDSSHSDLSVLVEDLGKYLGSNEARLIFVREINGLSTLLLLFQTAYDEIALEKGLDTVIEICAGTCDLEDDCSKAGLLAEAIRLLKHPAQLVRIQAAEALSALMGGSFGSGKEVVDSDAFESLERMVDSRQDDEITPAISVLHRSIEYISPEASVMLTKRLGRKIVALVQSESSSTGVICDCCGFLKNCMVPIESYSTGLALGFLDAIRMVYQHTKYKVTEMHCMRAFWLVAVSNSETGMDLASQRESDQLLLPDLLRGLRNHAHPALCEWAVRALAHVAKRGLCTKEFMNLGVYDELEKHIRSSDMAAMFNSCLLFLENLVHADEEIVSSSLRVGAFVDVAMQKVISRLDDKAAPDMLEATLSGLLSPIWHESIRERFLKAGGIVAYSQLLIRLSIESQNAPVDTMLDALKILPTIMVDSDTSEVLHNAGATKLVLDLMSRDPPTFRYLWRSIANFLGKSDGARAVIETRMDFVPLVSSSLASDVEEMFYGGACIVMASLNSPSLYEKLVQSGVYSTLIDMGTRSPQKSTLDTVYQTLNFLINSDVSDKEKIINTMILEQAISKTISVLLMETFESHELREVIRFLRTILNSRHFPIHDSILSVTTSVFQILRRFTSYDSIFCFYALQCLVPIVEFVYGREITLAEDPNLKILKDVMTEPTLIIDPQVQEVACYILYRLSDGSGLKLVTTIIEQDFVEKLSKNLFVPNELRRNSAESILIQILHYDNDLMIHDVVKWDLVPALAQLLSSLEPQDIGHAFKIMFGCPSARRGKLLLEGDLINKIIVILGSTTPKKTKWQCFKILSEFWSQHLDYEEEESHIGLISCIQQQLCGEVKRLKKLEAAKFATLESKSDNTSSPQNRVESAATDITNVASIPERELAPLASALENVLERVATVFDDEDNDGDGDYEMTSSKSALLILTSLPLKENITKSLVAESVFKTLAELLRYHDHTLVKHVLRATYRMAAEGTLEIRRVILEQELEALVRLHSHNEYSTHAEATESIKEIALDTVLLLPLIQQLDDFLSRVPSEEVLLSTTLLVIDELVHVSDKTEAAATKSIMTEVGMPEKITELLSHSSVLVRNRALQAFEGLREVGN